MLTKLAVWYLEKRKRSVMIGFQVQPLTVRALNKKGHLRDVSLSGVKLFSYNGTEIATPKGRVHEANHERK